MKKIIAVLAVLIAFSGATLAAQGENPNPVGAYLSGGYGTAGSGLLAAGVDWNFNGNLYLYGELFGTQFKPFSIGAIGGLDYEFIRQPLQAGSDFEWYIRAGGALGGSSLGDDNMLLISGTGVAGMTLDLENAGKLFWHFRPHLGMVINPSGVGESDKKVGFLWTTSVAFGYRF